MTFRSKLWPLAACASALVLFGGVSIASAAVTVGQTAPTSGDVFSCGGATLFVQTAVASGPSYVIPEDGVLTSWSARGDNADSGSNGERLKLKVVDPLGSHVYRIEAEDQMRTIALNTLNTFGVQIPVQAGDVIALWLPTGNHPCLFDAQAGDQYEYRAGSHPEPGVGDTFTTDSFFGSRRVNVSANLETQKCANRAPTIAGTPGDDSLTGTNGDDAIVGLGGDDVIGAAGGEDCVAGNAGKDVLRGGAGHDIVVGGGGNDKLRGQNGRDRLKGKSGKDKLNGGTGKDKLKGGPGKDKLRGAGAKDKIKGNGGADRIGAQDGKKDRVNCGGGNDRAVVDPIDRVKNCETVKVVDPD